MFKKFSAVFYKAVVFYLYFQLCKVKPPPPKRKQRNYCNQSVAHQKIQCRQNQKKQSHYCITAHRSDRKHKTTPMNSGPQKQK